MQENTGSFFKKCLNLSNTPSGEKALLTFLFILTVVFRLFHIKSATILEGKLLFIQPDAYYHIRRTVLFAQNFPSLNSFDYYISYPVGAECPWPPLYDWVIALISLIVSFGKPDNYMVELLHAIFPVLTAALSVFFVYGIAKTVFNNRAVGFLAAALWTFAPNSLSYSVFMSGDHHSASLFLAITFYYYAIRALKNLTEGNEKNREDYLAGIMAALGLLVWHIQIFFFTLWIMFIYILVVVKRKDHAFVKTIIQMTIKMMSLPIVISVIIRIISPIETEQGILRFDFFSFFQPLYILLLLLPLFYFYIFFSVRSKKTFLLYSLVIIAFIIGLMLMFTPLVSAIKEMKVFMSKSEPYLTNIQEYNPLFKKGHFMWGGWVTIENYFKFIYYAMPAFFSLFFIIRFLLRRKLKKSDMLLFPLLLLMFTTTILQFYQKRWGNENSFCISVTHGVIIYYLFHLGKQFRPKTVISFLFTGIYLGAIIYPIAAGTAVLMYKKVVPVNADLYYTLNWIKDNTPKTSHYLKPTEKPEYGILTPWDIGHLTVYYGERPVIACNFGHSLRGTGFRDSMAIWQTKDDADLAKICERNNVRFLIISDPLGYMTGLENMKFFYPYPAMRLMQYDGSFSPFGAALEHFRLIHESYTRNENSYNLTDVRMYKVYEFVKGARVKGKTYPLHDVNITTTFRSDKNREFTWTLRTFSDEKGNFSCNIPYATENVKYSVRAVYPFRAKSRDKEIVFTIDEADVQNGREINLNFVK